ncbi:MAG TPA: AMP-binding protein [bacterium]|nr:AMP-binding protein [bacterium]HPN33929.1 AMP-binding protein [bacterium]
MEFFPRPLPLFSCSSRRRWAGRKATLYRPFSARRTPGKRFEQSGLSTGRGDGSGPAEFHCFCSGVSRTVQAVLDHPASVGVAMKNVKVLIVDEQGRPLPIGQKGEVVVRSEAVAGG